MNIAGARIQANKSTPKARNTIMALRHSQNSTNPCESLLHIINDIKALPDENAAVMTFAEFESYNIKQIYIIFDKLLDDTDEISLQLAR
jgi:transcriptional regulator of met regulon